MAKPKTRSRLLLLIVLTLMALVPLSWASVAWAQGATISGSAKTEDGTALPGTSITALNEGNGRSVTVETDAAGAFSISGISAGRYRVIASLSGFAETSRALAVEDGATVTSDFVLSLGSLIEEISVTAERAERSTSQIPQTVTVISREAIEQRMASGTQELLERAPSVRQLETNPLRARPQLRGLSSSRVLILVDGERINNARFDAGATGQSPGLIDISQLESVEVVGGAASSLYGTDSIAGTINMVTKAPDRPIGGKTFNVNLDGQYNANSGFTRTSLAGGLGAEKWALRVSASRFEIDDYDVGGEAIRRSDVIRLGSFANTMSRRIGTTLGTTYVVYELPDGAETVNNSGEGENGQLDFWFFPNQDQSLRLRYLISQHEDLGQAFSDRPFDNFNRFNKFRDFEKISGRWEWNDVNSWLPRVSAGAYHQVFERPQNDINFTVVTGSSYNSTTNTFTGNLTNFSPGSDTETLNEVTSEGLDFQFNITPWANAFLVTGMQFLRDESRDTFNRKFFNAAGAVIREDVNKKSTPDSDYENLGWFSQLEWFPIEKLRVSAGLRWDNWQSEAVGSAGFPPGNELAVLNSALPALRNNPGAINLDGIAGIEALASGSGSLKTDNDVVTGNFGLTLLLPGGFNPYVRFATSYREPEVTTRYILRNFGTAVITIAGIPNTELEPEEGENLDVGIKIDRERWRASVGYFRNDLTNFITTVFSPTFCVPTNPALGILTTPFPPCVGLRQHQASFFQRVNIGEAVIDGIEAQFTAAIALGDKGSLTPAISLSWLEGENKTPSATDLTLINNFYNRDDTPIELEGSANDVPFNEMVPLQGSVALRWASPSGRWYTEWEWLFADQMKRVPPATLTTANLTQYGILASLEGFDKHSVRAGYELPTAAKARVTVAVENIFDDLYFLPFDPAPAPGRSVVLGVRLGWNGGF